MCSPSYYRISILGEASPGLEDWFGGLALEALPGHFRLSGFLPDQSALLGVLDLIHNLGLTLLSVNRFESPPLHPGVPAEGEI